MSRLISSFSLIAIICSMSYFPVGSSQEFDTLTLQYATHLQTRVFDAKVEPIKAATVSAQTSGRIINIHYDVNDLVPQGAALLEITNKEQGASLAGAEAELAKAQAVYSEAQAQYIRYKELFPKGAISKGAMDEATAEAKAAKQAVSAARAQLIKAKESLNYTIVSAPFSGRVTQRFVEQGETISYGQALFSGYDTEQLRVVFQVSQQDLAFIRQLDLIRIQLADGQEITATDINPYHFADAQTHSHTVRVNFANPNSTAPLVGQWAKVMFEQPSKPTLLVPMSAIHRVGDLTSVYRKNGDKLVLNQVRLGVVDHINLQAQVLSGLMPSDEIVIDAAQYLIHSRAAKAKE
ncbi:efflux RND transporter periplasmic adaptor subunit [Shewanella inventionis]|uniref:Hemolysin D n=1 Tax=Shewanella inventionis TaxID=1738770 RepID=A0ABQ1IPG4_9GAMM|nr:efflux RND transporter periplasmic adaptor subunit [Shewanella inventionis]MCL1159038.1 efflux RND transporter periplasmic adaptor subunit [Shewanella inventionis]UAL42462.1 efflux RND transporter periplasmic adaptor subunit [Shewanella inventionis]GGB47532.1 hemolysin D [Shewanella inventionis]